MRVLQKLIIDCDADAAWRALHSPRAVAELYGPLIDLDPLDPGGLPTSWEPGGEVAVQLLLGGLVPLGRQLIHVSDRDGDRSPARRGDGADLPRQRHPAVGAARRARRVGPPDRGLARARRPGPHAVARSPRDRRRDGAGRVARAVVALAVARGTRPRARAGWAHDRSPWRPTPSPRRPTPSPAADPVAKAADPEPGRRMPRPKPDRGIPSATGPEPVAGSTRRAPRPARPASRAASERRRRRG